MPLGVPFDNVFKIAKLWRGRRSGLPLTLSNYANAGAICQLPPPYEINPGICGAAFASHNTLQQLKQVYHRLLELCAACRGADVPKRAGQKLLCRMKHSPAPGHRGVRKPVASYRSAQSHELLASRIGFEALGLRVVPLGSVNLPRKQICPACIYTSVTAMYLFSQRYQSPGATSTPV